LTIFEVHDAEQLASAFSVENILRATAKHEFAAFGGSRPFVGTYKTAVFTSKIVESD